MSMWSMCRSLNTTLAFVAVAGRRYTYTVCTTLALLLSLHTVSHNATRETNEVWRDRPVVQIVHALRPSMPESGSGSRPSWWPTSPKERNALAVDSLQIAAGSPTREGPPSPQVPELATSTRPLKDEDTASTLESHICGEMVKLLLVADGHGGPAVAQLCATVGLQYLVDAATALGDASEASVHAASVRTFEHLHERAVQLSQTAGATLTIAVWNESRGELMSPTQETRPRYSSRPPRGRRSPRSTG